MDKEKMLKGIIQTYQNDYDCGYEESDKEELRVVILELIVELSRYVNDIRYCSKVDCPCSPEFNIRKIMNDHGGKLDKVIFSPYGLSDVNMLKVREELKKI